MIIIAEAGVNHNGSVDTAKKLVDVAAEAGADFVKFQTFKTEEAITKSAQKADYQIKNVGTKETQFEMVKKLELQENDFKLILNHCKKKNIKFLSTGFDIPSMDLLKGFNLDCVKIPSGEITNLPLLRKSCELKKPILLSTGMCSLEEVENAFDVLVDCGINKKLITILHCNTEYPTPMEDVNLNAMLTLKNHFKVNVGYSDHTLGIEIPVAAAALGATVIEKHFTLDRSLAGPDHAASLEPNELKIMVKSIRNIIKAMGNGIKKPSRSEKKNILIARKSIVATKSIKKGETFTEKNIGVKRPGTGVSPMKWDFLINKKSNKSYGPDDQIILKSK